MTLMEEQITVCRMHDYWAQNLLTHAFNLSLLSEGVVLSLAAFSDIIHTDVVKREAPLLFFLV